MYGRSAPIFWDARTANSACGCDSPPPPRSSGEVSDHVANKNNVKFCLKGIEKTVLKGDKVR